jgi:hypothetical protein
VISTKAMVFGVLSVALFGCGPAKKAVHPKNSTASAAIKVASYSAADLLAAFKEAYGQPAPFNEPTGTSLPDESGVEQPEFKIYNPDALIDVAPNVVALVVKGIIADGCHACTGDVSLFYLTHKDGHFDIVGRWPAFAGQQEFGGAASWTLHRNLTKFPAILFHNGGGGMGCAYEGVDIVELTPTKPILRARNIWTKEDYEEPAYHKNVHLTGNIRTEGDGHLLRVDYTGTEKFTVTYSEGNSGEQTVYSGHPAPSC